MSLPALDPEQIVVDRRHLHAHPELGFQEIETAAYVADRLQALGYAPQTGVGKTGVVATAGDGGRCVLIRADMDALPVHEENDVDYRSMVDGRMHACGHDGHVAVGLAVAKRLAEIHLPGRVKFAFQPAEEGGDGAGAMIQDGVLTAPEVHAAFGMHLWSFLPVGTIAVTEGPVFAAADSFEITVQGRGGHAAVPNQAVDPVLITAHIVTALQSVVARRMDPLEHGVVSVTSVQAGDAFNVIPETAVLRGTVRTFGGRIHHDAPERVREIAVGVAHAMGGDATVTYERTYPATVNDPAMATLMAETAGEIAGVDHVVRDVRTMGAEDMSRFLNAVPGCYALVGCGNPAKGAGYPHHSPHFNMDEDALPIAADLLSRTALRYLVS